MSNDGNSTRREPTFLDTLASVLAAFFGVQSRRNRERDFNSGKPWHYVVMGAVVTVLFVIILALIVQVVLRSAGA